MPRPYKGLKNITSVVLTDQDLARTDELAKLLDKPRSVLIREVLQAFLENQQVAS